MGVVKKVDLKVKGDVEVEADLDFEVKTEVEVEINFLHKFEVYVKLVVEKELKRVLPIITCQYP